MSLETLTFTEELKKLDRNHEELKESERKLRDFILSPSFLDEYNKFEQLLGDFQDKLVTLAESVSNPIVNVQPNQPVQIVAPGQPEEETVEEKTKEKTFTYEKALVIVAALISCGISVQKGFLPPLFFITVVFLSVFLPFLPQIQTAIRNLHAEKSEEEEESIKIESWINDLGKMRSLYVSARLLIKVQNQTKESLPHYGLPGMDESLYNRKKHFSETLPSEFLNIIGKIMNQCDKAIWNRKTLLVMAIVQAKQVPIPGRGA